MKNFLKKIPIPICGLILAIVSLGNLLKLVQFKTAGNLIGLVGIILVVIIMIKIVITFEHTKLDLKNPIIASVAPTFTMATMVVATYLNEFAKLHLLATIIWLSALSCHILLMLYFTHYFAKKSTIHSVYPSWFIVYVGIGVGSVTSHAFSPLIGQIAFWSALFMYVVLLPIIIKKVYFIKNMHESTMPLITIIAAPGSLCLAGYLNAFANPNVVGVTVLLIFSQLIYCFVLCQLPKLLTIQFYPSYAAFTFPLVITAMAATLSDQFYTKNNYIVPMIHDLAIYETIFAAIIVTFVFIKYMHHLATK